MQRKRLGILGLVTASMGALATALAGSAQAQQSSEDVGAETAAESVIVVGRRTVLAPAPAVKRKSDAIIDSITAETIQTLPDASVADVLERLPGVSTEVGFNSTRARYATLRGFDARYNSTEIDGNLIWNSSRNNRGTQIDIFPAGVANEINVYKTVLPDQDANSIGGHIEVRSLRAFDGGDKPYANLRASIGGYDQDGSHSNDGADGPSYRISAIGKTTFGRDNSFGVVVGAELQRDVWYSRYNSVTGYSQINGRDVVNASIFNAIYDNASRTQSFYGKLEARRGDRLYAFLSAAYFRDQEEDQWFRTGPFLTASRVTNVSEGRGVFPSLVDEAYVEDYSVDRKTLAISSGLDVQVSGNSALKFRGGYTKYDHFELVSTGEKWQFNGLSGSYELGETGTRLTVNPSAVSNPASWTYRNRAARERSLPDTDDVYSLRADYEHNVYRDAHGLGFKSGVAWRRIDREFNQTDKNYVLPAGVTFPLTSALVSDAPIDGVSPIYIDSSAYWNKLHAGTLTIDQALTADYHLIEDVYAAYGGLYYTAGAWRVLAGVRVEATKATDETNSIERGVAVPVENDIDYTNWLPNVQAQYDFRPDLRLRASYTETLARPDFSDFAMGQTITFDANGAETISGTNPFLEPRTAQNYDLSLEYYGENAFAAIGVFRKDLDHETFRRRIETRDGAGTLIRTEQFPLNTGSASVQGVEAAMDVRNLGMLPRSLGKLGLSANYTLLDGNWHVVFDDGSSRTVDGLRNQPHWLGNVALNYAVGPFSAKLAYHMQGRTFSGTFGATPAGDIWINDNNRLDLQVRVKLGRSFEIFGEARNLTDEWKSRSIGVDDSLWTASTEGRSGFVGLRYTY